MEAFDTTQLRPGDHLLYSPCDWAGRITSFKTWSPAVHIEIYIGNGQSVASRNGLGVNRYPLRTAQLVAVLRPNASLDMARAMAWFSEPFQAYCSMGVQGRPYGWATLARFYNIHLNSVGWICSEFAAMFDVAGGFHPFADAYCSGSIDPGDYFISPKFDWIWLTDKARKAVGKF
jgi:hypothetical protein